MLGELTYQSALGNYLRDLNPVAFIILWGCYSNYNQELHHQFSSYIQNNDKTMTFRY